MEDEQENKIVGPTETPMETQDTGGASGSKGEVADGGNTGGENNGDVNMEERDKIDIDPRNDSEPNETVLEDAVREKREPRVQSPVKVRNRYDDILMPGITPPHDERHPTPERSQASARPTPMDASIPAPKMRRLDPDNPMEGDVKDDGSDLSIDQLEERKILGMLLQGVDITEMFSPERVAKIGANYKLIAGKSMDFTTGYDFTLDADQKRAWEHITSTLLCDR